MSKIRQTDLAWMAAIVDTHGRVIRKNNKTRNTPQVILKVDTSDSRVGLRLAELTGTGPEPKEKRFSSEFMRKGCSIHCPQPHVHVYEGEEDHVVIPEI